MPTIIVQADWPQEVSERTSLIERVVPGHSRDEAYIRQLVERITWALEDAEQALEADIGVHQVLEEFPAPTTKSATSV